VQKGEDALQNMVKRRGFERNLSVVKPGNVWRRESGTPQSNARIESAFLLQHVMRKEERKATGESLSISVPSISFHPLRFLSDWD
jgi:hypothetical protein